MIYDTETAQSLNTVEGRLSQLWWNFQQRWQDRDARHAIIDAVIRGDWSALGPDDETLENRSPNMVQVALEDTAEAASLIPSVRVQASGPTPEHKRKATRMEQYGQSYLEASEVDLLTIQTLMNLGAHGQGVWVVQPSKDGPRLEWRDPRTCYVEPNYSTLSALNRAFFARSLYVTQLPVDYQAKFYAAWSTNERHDCPLDQKLTLLEFFTDEVTVTAGVYENQANAIQSLPGMNSASSHASYVTVIFDDVPNLLGICPVVLGQRLSTDPEPRGQFDQAVPLIQAHIRLQALSLDYADQAVYSDVWVKDLIGELPMGGGSYINLGPQGAIGRVPPAVTGLSVYQELQQLIDNFHIAARWPKVRPGEVDQAIASAKFVEATAGMMNTVIRTYHLILKRMFTKALRLCFEYDKLYGTTRRAAGVHKNQQFTIEVDTDDIDLEANVRVEYGLGLGRDPAQSMVLGIQASQSGFVSREFVQENFEGINDVGLEKIRLDVQQLQDMAMAKLLQGLQEGQIPGSALVDIAKARQNGDDLFEVYNKFVVKPEEAAKEEMMQSGLTGGLVPPGADPTAGAVPPAPPPEALLAGLVGGGGGAPAPPESIGRLSVPLGGGGFAGTQSTSGGPPA